MEARKVSIIVPVYKVEKYLEECLDSLKNQTYKNLEIILCDDGSPDRCPEICENYAKNDGRFKVIHQMNGGAASARNVGLDIITGRYVGFVDSDDWVDFDYIYRLVENLENDGADIAVCSFYDVYTHKKQYVEMGKEGIYSEKEYLERFLWDWKCGLLWNKLYKREVIEHVRFPEGHVIDDEFFTYKVVMNAKKVTVSKEPLIFYRKRKSGAMNQGAKKKILIDRIQYITERYENVVAEYPELKEAYLENLCDNIIKLTHESKEHEDTKKMIRKVQLQYLYIIISSSLKLKQKYAYLKNLFQRKIEVKVSCNAEKNFYYE